MPRPAKCRCLSAAVTVRIRAVDAFATIEYCTPSVIIIGGIGLVPVSPDAAEGFYRLVTAATVYPCICIWSVSGCAEIGRMYPIAIELLMAREAHSCRSSLATSRTPGGRSSVLRVKAAATIAFSPGKGRKRYGCVTPARLAIASAEVP